MELIPFLQSLAYLAAICGFVWYMRKDSKDDCIRMQNSSKEEYMRLETKLEAWRDETNKRIDAIALEMKDFHGKLCAIEERKKMER